MISIDNYPRLANETDDAPRIMRAIADAPSGTLYLPEGEYQIASPIIIENQCSVQMDAMAVMRAVKEMEFVLKWVGPADPWLNPAGSSRNYFIKGGEIDAMGIASCLQVQNFMRFTLKDTTFKNGKKYGLCVGPEGGGCEMMANNLYFLCTVPDCQGNIAIYTKYTDGHYTDVVVVDYSIGIYDDRCCSNRFTRVHVWVGAMQVDGVPQYLKGSINYVVNKAPDSTEDLFRDCYADTGEIGFDLYCTTRLLGCAYYNNYNWLKFDNVLCIRNNTTDPVQVIDGCWTKTSPNAKFYQGIPGENVLFQNNIFRGGLTNY